MPALLIIKKTSPPVETDETWLAGQIVQTYEGSPSIGGGAAPAAGGFVQYHVTDKTKAEMDAFLATYDKDIDMTVINGTPPGLLRINCRNNNTNVTGTVGGWTVAGTDRIISEWNLQYVTSNLVTIGIITGTNPDDTWQCEGVFTVAQSDEFETVIIENGLKAMDMRKIWYIPPVVMANIIGAGGTQTGTSAQLQMRDARLE